MRFGSSLGSDLCSCCAPSRADLAMGFEWRAAGTSFNVLWLLKYMSGGLPPPDAEGSKSFLQVSDIGVKRIADAKGGLGIPNSFLYWHWSMVVVFLAAFSGVFCLTTPSASLGEFPWPAGAAMWVVLVQKLMIFWYGWEALGLGVLHGPLHAKMAPPFADWWYRWTPGTIKYNAPFMPCLTSTRNYLDVLVEGVLTYAFIAGCLCSEMPSESCWMVPLTSCAVYEFVFDYGQHMHTYGTQNLHTFVCMCFSLEQGQVVGIQLFVTWFYLCSGWCKLGPWFKHLNTANLMSAKYMVGKPWSQRYRKLMFTGHDSDDYHLTRFAAVFGYVCAVLEVLGPLLCLSTDPHVVVLGIVILACMHLYIISTLIVDVFTWNFVDMIWYVILFGLYRTGFDWNALPRMHPLLAAWLGVHVLYAIYGNLVPNHVPYVVAHRHAAGNFSQGVLCVKKTAAAKLAKLRAHAGLPSQQPGWAGEWLAFHAVWAYFWLWNLPSKMLAPLVVDILGSGAPADGMFHSSGEYLLLHSVLFFDALIAHVRFDGLSSVNLVGEVGRVCGFEEGECVLAWVGAFPSFPASLLTAPKASWKIVDSKAGTVKEGVVSVAALEDPEYKKPSDCSKLLATVQGDGYKPLA
mmetsp:Transcript_78338/g.242903  ORF Transcript_78338/g.242903 Transcript_78338/m.242903 type:complete len:628 (+) Transcript_78338:41-1924(+)